MVEETKEEAPKKGEGEEEEEEAEEAPPEDPEEAKAPQWNPKDYKWTITNGHAKNLPQLFRDCKGGGGMPACILSSSFSRRNILSVSSLSLYISVTFFSLSYSS